MVEAEIDSAITHFESELGIPVTDALIKSSDHLVEMVLASFPQLRKKSIGIIN